MPLSSCQNAGENRAKSHNFIECWASCMCWLESREYDAHEPHLSDRFEAEGFRPSNRTHTKHIGVPRLV